jgi:parvulin-like peptidyl-prolyl isomerase
MSSKYLIAATLLCAPLVHAADRPDTQVRVVEEIVAKVNGKIITRGELERQRARIRMEYEKQGLIGAALEQAVNKTAADALRDQIDQLLLVQKAGELNINVDADVNRRVADIQRESGIADPDKFHDWVREQSGESFEDLKDAFKNQILTQRVIGEEVYRTIIIPKADMQKYYDEHMTEFVRKESVSIGEIQIAIADNKPATIAAAEKKARDLVARLRQGEKFPELARQNSDNPLTAKEDGFLGNFARGELAKPIEDAAFSQSKGYISDPIRMGNSPTNPGLFEIVKVLEKVNPGQATFDEAQQEINARLSEPQVQPKLRAYLTTLRQDAFLQIKPGYIDSGAASDKDTAWKDPATLKPQTTTKEAVANARHFKKLWGVVPYGITGEKDKSPAVPPETSPVPQTPVKNADGSSPQ